MSRHLHAITNVKFDQLMDCSVSAHILFSFRLVVCDYIDVRLCMIQDFEICTHC